MQFLQIRTHSPADVTCKIAWLLTCLCDAVLLVYALSYLRALNKCGTNCVGKYALILMRLILPLIVKLAAY